MIEPFFRRDSEGAFVATESTRGPWSRDHQHGGPPSALAMRAMEALAIDLGVPAAMRVTIDLLRPLPIGRVVVRAESTPEGRGVRRLHARLEIDGVEVMRAAGLFGAPRAIDVSASPDTPPPSPPTTAREETLPFFRWPSGYHTAMELRYARGRFGEPSVFAWMRMRAPLVDGEAPSPAQRVLVAADSGNGVTSALDWRTASFVNPDLTVALLRMPAGEWIGLEAEMRTETSALGLASTRLWDVRGVVGHGLQTLVVRRAS